MKSCFVLKYFSSDEYTIVVFPVWTVHRTLAFPLNVTDRDSIWQSLSNSSVTWPETQSPLVKAFFGFAAGSYETLRFFTVLDMVWQWCETGRVHTAPIRLGGFRGGRG